MHTPLWDPILSFLHTFSPKSAHVGGPCPPPPLGNPGSATDCDHVSMCMEKNRMVNLLKIDLIYKFLKSQIETCHVFGLFFMRKDCFTIAIVQATLQTTGVVFVSTELLTCSHIRHGRKIQHLVLQWLSVNGPRSWWD